jgi:hypothetical protein
VESAWLMIAPENHCFGTVGTPTLPGFHSLSVRGRTGGGASQAASVRRRYARCRETGQHLRPLTEIIRRQ